jgi:hypothetical protein
MPPVIIDSIGWNPAKGYRGYDIHIVRQGGQAAGTNNKSASLVDLLVGFSGGVQVDLPSTNGLFFNTIPLNSGLMTLTPQPPQTMSYGLTVSAATGEVTVSSNEPAPISDLVIRNFIIEASLSPFIAPIRVQVHTTRTEVVMSPSKMSIRSGETAGFSLLGLFDDGIAADLTFHPGLSWQGSGPFTVDANTGIVTVDPTVTSGSGTVTVNIPSELGGGSATANVEILPGWASLDVTASFLGGPGVLQRARPDVRNVLILPEGFSATDQDQTAFLNAASKMVSTLTLTGGTFRPYDLLKERFNYYRAWIAPPTGEGGITNLMTFAKVSRPSSLKAIREVFPMKPKNTTAGIKTLAELIYTVGVPTQKEPVDTVANYLNRWNALFAPQTIGFDPSIDASHQTQIMKQWLEQAGRVVDLDKNSLFSLAAVGRSQVAKQPAVTEIGFHPRRGSRAAINKMLMGIKALDENNAIQTIGTLWSDSASQSSHMVIFLCRASRMGGTAFFEGDFEQAAFSTTTRSDPDLVFRLNTSFVGLDVFDTDEMGKAVVATAAHEFGHILTLADEYGGVVGSHPINSDIDQRFNVQFETDLTTASGGIKTSAIRWKWPRVAKAAVVKTVADNGDGTFTVTVEQGQAAVFADHDAVAIRPQALVPFALPTVRLQVNGSPNVRTDTLKVRVTSGTGVPTTNVAGFILYAFTTGTADVDGNDIVTIIHRAVLASMATNGPLTRTGAGVTCSPPAVLGGASDPQIPINAPAALLRLKSALVGLYDGGDRFNCGVLHATGDCTMRASPAARVVNFCHVCRYILVDAFYPAGHKTIDADFKYPTAK